VKAGGPEEGRPQNLARSVPTALRPVRNRRGRPTPDESDDTPPGVAVAPLHAPTPVF